MADSSPFANAGLGMFGAEKKYIQEGMQGKGDFGLGAFLGAAIGLTPKETSKKNEIYGSASPSNTQYEPQTAFPDVLQQQYVSPYISGAGSAMPAPTTSLQGFMTQPYRAPTPANPMAGFKTLIPFTAQPQTTASGYHPVTEELWGK
jgi:hypothetical protein